MNTRHTGPRSRGTNDQAAFWYIAMQGQNPSEQLLRRWQKWMVVPANKHAFDDAEEVWQLMASVPAPRWPTDAEVEADTYDGSMPIAAFEQRSRTMNARRSRRFNSEWVGLAAVIGFVVFGLSFTFSSLDVNKRSIASVAVFETHIAQHDSIDLEDGSRIDMGGRTSVTSTVNSNERFIVMDRGEAFFHVKHDPTRPFRVLAGGAIITAVGTEFNVRRLDNLVFVTVNEGTVEVTPVNTQTVRYGGDVTVRGKRVTVGEQLSYDDQGRLGLVVKVDLATALAWKDGRLAYGSEPLSRVMQDAARYSTKKVIIADAGAANYEYSGTVFERDIDDWMLALGKFPQLQVMQPDDERVVISSRKVEQNSSGTK